MKMLIDKIKLKLLLEQKRDYIKSSIDGVDVVISAVIYMVSLLCSKFNTVMGVNYRVISTLAWVLAVIFLIYGLRKIIISRENRYNHKTLFKDIENLDEILHKFSLVAIKDEFNSYANKVLLYYDNSWKCWFLFSFHTNEYQNEESILQRLSNKLKIDKDCIKINYISDRLQPKYSEKDHVHKVYQHSLYQCSVTRFPEIMKNNEFEIEGTKYKWWALEEMEADENIMKKNGDVVSFLKEKIQ